MPNFQYTATDQTGAQTQGTFEAANEQQAYEQLAQYGLTVSQVIPLDPPASSKSTEGGVKGQGKKKKNKGLLAIELGGGPSKEDISVFTRQMSTLVQAGLPLLRSLEVMIKQQEKKPKFKDMLTAISEKVSSGGNLSDGLAMYPKTFDNLYVNMVKAGEAGGVLDLVLDRLAQFQEKSIRTIKKVKSAMIYPSVIMFVAIAIVTLLMMVVVPQFQTIFEQMLRGAPLPGPTQIVIGISDLFSSSPILVLGGMFGTVLGLFLFKKTKPGSKTFDWLAIHIPSLNSVYENKRDCLKNKTLESRILLPGSRLGSLCDPPRCDAKKCAATPIVSEM